MAKCFRYSKSPMKLSINHIELKTTSDTNPNKLSNKKQRTFKTKRNYNSFSLNSSSKNSAEKTINFMITNTAPHQKNTIKRLTKNSLLLITSKSPTDHNKEITPEDRFIVSSIFDDAPLQLKMLDRPMSAPKPVSRNKNPNRNALFYDRVARFINRTQTPFT